MHEMRYSLKSEPLPRLSSVNSNPCKIEWNAYCSSHQPDAHHQTPAYKIHGIAANLAGDLIFVADPLCGGDDFWNKLRALFIHRAKAHFPAAT